MSMSVREFNYHIKRAKFDGISMNAIYLYCLPIVKEHVHYRYGSNNFYNEIPHDVVTRITIEYPPKKYIDSPIAYICKVTQNYLNNLTKLNDNQTLELFDNYPYELNFENNMRFDEKIIPSWHKLDYLSRYILYLNVFLKYKLKEIAELLNLKPDYVRTKKCRAVQFLKNEIKKEKLKKEEEKV